MYPDGWSRYALLARLDGAKPKSHLARFAARYRFAGQLNSIEVLGMSPATTDSYLATLRLALAYSALEALETEFKGQHKLQVIDRNLARQAKSPKMLALRNFAQASAEKRLKDRLEQFFEHENNVDLRPLIEALRHAMFHGNFNPSSTGVNSKTVNKFVNQLCERVFAVINERSAETFASLSLARDFAREE